MLRTRKVDDYDFEWVSGDLYRFLRATKPEIRQLFHDLIQKEGRIQGLYTFNQIIAEMKHRFGLEPTVELLSGDPWRK